jgi:hypothetical protein
MSDFTRARGYQMRAPHASRTFCSAASDSILVAHQAVSAEAGRRRPAHGEPRARAPFREQGPRRAGARLLASRSSRSVPLQRRKGA